MPAVGLVDVRGEHSTDVRLGAPLAHRGRFHIVPSVRRQLADLCLVIVRVEVKMAPLCHDVYAGLTGVHLGLVVDAPSESVHLLRLQVDMQADQVAVPSRILQVRLAHIQECINHLDKLGAHFPRRDLPGHRVKLSGEGITIYFLVHFNAVFPVKRTIHQVLPGCKALSFDC